MNSTVSKLSENISALSADTVSAFFILIIGAILGKLAQKLLEFIFSYFTVDQHIKRLLGVRLFLKEIIPSLVAAIIYIVSVVMALVKLGVANQVLSMLSWIVIVLVGISLVLSLYEAVPNIVHGVSFLRYANIEVGDKISIDEHKGIVKNINLTSISLEIKKGEIVVFPISVIRKKVIRKYVGHKKKVKE